MSQTVRKRTIAEVDRGAGYPLILIPGIQGRWQWMAPTIRALQVRHRVLSFSLTSVADGPGAEHSPVFARWMDAIDGILDQTGLARAVIVGVSFGGLIAARYAARRPERTAALVLVSAPAPIWRPDRQAETYLRRPWASVPAFTWRACRRLWPEVVAAQSSRRARVRFALEYATRAVRFPISPPRMADWVREWKDTDIVADCARIRAETLLITGERHLDQVVPLANTLEYLDLIPHVRHVTLAGTGHVGLVSKPDEFARLVGDFVEVVERRAHAH